MRVSTDADLYAVLGVSPDASIGDLRAAKKRMQRLHHPDRGGDVHASALVNHAFDVLSDPAARSAYDNRRPSKVGIGDFHAHFGFPQGGVRPEPAPAANAASAPVERHPRVRAVVAPVLAAVALLYAHGWLESLHANGPALLRPLGTLAIPALFIIAVACIPLVSGNIAEHLVTRLGMAKGKLVATLIAVAACAAVLVPTQIDGLSGIPGWFTAPAAAESGPCRLVASGTGATAPDPACSQSVLAEGATTELICAAGLGSNRPSPADIRASRQAVGSAYAMNATDVYFVLPPRLGGAWDTRNLWPRGEEIPASTIDGVRSRLCDPQSGLTLRDVVRAANSNQLSTLVATEPEGAGA